MEDHRETAKASREEGGAGSPALGAHATSAPGARASAPPKARTAPVLLAWAMLAGLLVLLALPHRTAPGLNYDEAVLAGLARDLLAGHARAEHVPTASTIVVGYSNYVGSLK